jgi:coenzyme PQQ precursor peptide PqqA
MIAFDASSGSQGPPKTELEETSVSWNAPVVIEVCAGMEVTAYLSAEM